MTDELRAARAAALWIDALEAVAGRAAHELRNALNGAAVNLEVVRSRSLRPGSTGEQVSAFAQSASTQLDQAAASFEALVSLVRPPRAPADVGRLLGEALALLRATAPPGAGALEAPPPGQWLTSANPSIVRLVLTRLVLDGVAAGRFRSTAERIGDGIQLRIQDVTPGPETIAALDVATASGIAIRPLDGDGIMLTFPASETVGA